jgi:hypothetical protein
VILTLDKKRTSYHKARRAKRQLLSIAVRRIYLSECEPHVAYLYAFQKFWQHYFAKNLDDARKFFYVRAFDAPRIDAITTHARTARRSAERDLSRTTSACRRRTRRAVVDVAA